MIFLKKIIDICKKYNYILTSGQKRWGVVVLLLSIVGAAFETLGVSVILPLVQVIMDINAFYKLLPADIADYLKNNYSATDVVWILGICIIIIYIVKNSFLMLLSYARSKYACKVKRELNLEMIDSYISRGYIYFQNVSVGKYLRGMGYSVSMAYEGLYQILRLLSELLALIFICVYILISDPVMAFGVVLVVSVCMILVLRTYRKLASWSGKVIFQYDDEIQDTKLTIYHGIKELLVMRRSNFFVERLKHCLIQQQKGEVCRTVVVESPAYLIEASCVMAMIIFVCIRATGSGDITQMIPQLATFAVAAFRILPSLGRISSAINSFMSCIEGINETYTVIGEARSYKKESMTGRSVCNDRENIKLTKSLPIPREWGRISLRNIVWSYDTSLGNVINGINLDIERGKSIALVGASGSGKTTLGDIVLGLLHPQQGNIFLDDINIQAYDGRLETLLGFVPQMVYLINDSIKNNIAFGMSESEIDDEKVNRAVEQAQLKEFVGSLPNGLDTVVGESGTRLSGGQRQRIAIARALYEDPEVLILDEATSALDTETEKAVMEAVDTLQGKKTLIIIAHRLTTIKKCDIIYQVKEGKLQQRKYEELV